MKALKNTSYLWIGGIAGVIAQMLGSLYGHIPLCFSGLLADMTVYPLILLFVIHRDVAAKAMFRDIFLFFLGLDFTYYGYVIVKDVAGYNRFGGSLSSVLLSDVPDFIGYTLLGTAAAAWGWCMVKLFGNGKKLLYHIMAAPFFAVQIIFIISDINSWDYRWSSALLGTACLAADIYLYTVKSPWKRANDRFDGCPAAA